MMTKKTVGKRRSSARSAVVMGLGQFGFEVLAAFNQASQTRPGLATVEGLWAGSDGWQTLAELNSGSELETSSSTWDDPAAWWQNHGDDGLDLLQGSILRALDSPGTGSETMVLYIIGHLHEPATQGLWRQLLNDARTAYVPEADLVFTLILATDSLSLLHFTPDEARAMLDTLDDLSAELVSAADGQELPGRVGWCYFLDTLDTHTRPLSGAADRKSDRAQNGRGQGTGEFDEEALLAGSATPHIVQVHMAAEFLALLAAGLQDNTAYVQSSLAHAQREFLGREKVARVSAFGAGSLLFPVSNLAQEARDSLARTILAGFILGDDKPGDLPAARQLRSRWRDECTLDPTGLRNRIQRDHGGNPLVFPVEPPQVREVPDDRLVDHLLNWDMLLWGRWRSPHSPAAKMVANAEALEREAAGWLENQLDPLLQREVGGHRVAGLFIAEAREAIEDERLKLDEAPGPDRFWLSVLLDKAPIPRRDRTALPDLAASRRQLEAALRGRLNRRAVWTRASLIGAALLTFAWTAYLAAGESLGLRGLISHWLKLETSSTNHLLAIDLAGLALSALVLVFLAGFIQIALSESAIHRATDKLISDIRRKYRALQLRALLDERERVYATLFAELTHWEKFIESRQQILADSLAGLDEALQEQPDPAPLQTEQNLLPRAGWPALMPHYDIPSQRHLAEVYLNQPDLPAWKEETAGQLIATLRAFLEKELSEWHSGLNLATWSARPGNPGPLKSLLQGLRDNLTPAWPLSREDRVPVISHSNREGNPLPYEEVTRPLLVFNFIGLPDGETNLAVAKVQGDEFFTTGEAGRLAYAPTVHALDLQDLRLRKRLLALAAIEVLPVEEEVTAAGDGPTDEPPVLEDESQTEDTETQPLEVTPC